MVVLGMGVIRRALVTMTMMTMAPTSATTTVRVTAAMIAVLSAPPEPLLEDDWRTRGLDTPFTVRKRDEDDMDENHNMIAVLVTREGSVLEMLGYKCGTYLTLALRGDPL